nr:hypothetical protein CFP56_32448 [Quercus suber]
MWTSGGTKMPDERRAVNGQIRGDEDVSKFMQSQVHGISPRFDSKVREVDIIRSGLRRIGQAQAIATGVHHMVTWQSVESLLWASLSGCDGTF